MISPFKLKKIFFVAGAIIVIAGLFNYEEYRYSRLRAEKINLEEKVAVLEENIAGLKNSVASTSAELESEKNKSADLAHSLEAEQNINRSFESQIGEISGTVGKLQKLSETDPELLKKYSRVYFLSENYAPAQLSSIDSKYLYDKKKPQLIHPAVLPRLQAMLESASREGVEIQVVSAYRSFYEQASLKSEYKVIYGAGTANQFSADQGYSEHQLGTTVDFTTPETKDVFSKFEAAGAYKWLNENAYKFGFILSYPKDNSYYQFEPWHWRFVGIALATALHEKNEYFYNLSQGEIDKYLVSIFD